MYKVVVLDIDDTLLSDSGQISDETKDVIQQIIHRNKITVVLATGRMFVSAQKIAAELGVEAPIIAYQGALVKSQSDGRVLYERVVDPASVKSIIEYAESKHFHLHIYSKDVLYVKEENDKVRRYSDMHGAPYTVIPDFYELIESPVSKMLLFEEPETLDQAIRELLPTLKESCYLTKSKPFFLEILHREVNKGEALRMFLKDQQCSQSEVLAIGDSWNDKELFKAAGFTIAMGNAIEELKEAADYVTSTNNDDGVRKALEKFILNVGK
ncbi:hydrolase [Cohnella kolymensis]|uniref:Hydrolase n=1 Tax=Cohnella kolymensis TaxID=1590652 RepID=A0ABR5A7Z7_9BACL|nr:hydrolase [Cohnella kolymensis]